MFAAICLTTVAPSAAWAQSKNKEPTPEEQKGYTLPYFFSLAAVLAVTVCLCRPAGRKWDIDELDEDEL